MATRNIQPVPPEEIPLQRDSAVSQSQGTQTPENIENASAAAHIARKKKIQKYIVIVMSVITILFLLIGVFTKKDDTETQSKIESLNAALYKFMQLLANNPQILAIGAVEGNQQVRNDFTSIDFQPQRRNFSASG